MKKSDEASSSIILAGRALLVKCSLVLNCMVYLVQILYINVFEHCPATGMKKGDEASPSIILAGRALR